METGSNIVVLTNEQLSDLIKNCAKAASDATLKTLKEERRNSVKRMQDRRLHNTELLLRNYNMFKLSVEQSVFTVRQLEKEQGVNEILNVMMGRDNDEITLNSIKESKVKTAIILDHIDTMLELYHIFCERSSDEIDIRRYEVLIDRYIADPQLSVKDISEKQNVSKESVYSDLKIAKERVSALIFGIDGIQMKK